MFKTSDQADAILLHENLTRIGKVIGSVPPPDLQQYDKILISDKGHNIPNYYRTGQYLVGSLVISKVVGRDTMWVVMKAVQGKLPHIKLGYSNRIVVDKMQLKEWMIKEGVKRNENSKGRAYN